MLNIKILTNSKIIRHKQNFDILKYLILRYLQIVKL
jgi:hypothetical protein